MKTKEQKAFEIAIAEGWSYNNESESFSKENSDIEVSNGIVIAFYLSYNGLMPIVFQIQDKINILSRKYCYKSASLSNDRQIDLHLDNEWRLDKSFKYSTEPEFLDALLDAVHFVLCENKEKLNYENQEEDDIPDVATYLKTREAEMRNKTSDYAPTKNNDY